MWELRHRNLKGSFPDYQPQNEAARRAQALHSLLEFTGTECAGLLEARRESGEWRVQWTLGLGWGYEVEGAIYASSAFRPHWHPHARA